MPATLLSDAVQKGPGEGEPVEKIHWLEAFTDKPRQSEFCEATDPAGHFESNSSTGHKEYQDRLRCIALRQEGLEKAEIADAIGRSAKFVQTWWKKEQKEVPKPAGVHDYLKTEFWRDIQIVRGFAKGLGVYETALPSTDWIDNMADGQGFKDGGSRLKYDKEGRMRPNGTQYSRDGYLAGRVPQLDKVTQKMLTTQGIDDRVLKRPGLLWYPDGAAAAIPHRHEAWTALLSFGQPRILTIDKHPVLLRDGDLIVFGTQRHGVPKMCTEGGVFEQYGGRMSVVFFFMPTGEQAKGAEPWKAILDEAPSRKMVAMQRDANLGAGAALSTIRSGPHREAFAQLTSLGFSEEEVSVCLHAAAFSVEKAAEMLLHGSASALMVTGGDNLGSAMFSDFSDREAQKAALYQRLCDIQSAGSDKVAIKGASSPSASDEDDEAVARRLQQQEERGPAPDDWELRAILEQLEELERSEQAEVTGASLQAQFACYDEMLDAVDADQDWDGRGDLMVRPHRRENLQIEQQDSTTLYSIGCSSDLHERQFFELLSVHSIRVLYDLRAHPEVGGLEYLHPPRLEACCKARAVHYRHEPLGRDSAYGILKHLREDQGKNTLAELVWHGRRKHAAFLGEDMDWKADHRCAIAARLCQAGHKVMHVDRSGGLQDHPKDWELPDHIVGEEARLRMLEKKKQSGEDDRKHKSAASRSSEVVAQKLTQPRKEIDAGEELRKARTQRELCNIQRHLADLQRRSEGSDASAGLGPKLINVNKWVKAQAVEQQANLAAGKTKDGKEKVNRDAVPTDEQNGAASASSSSLVARQGQLEQSGVVTSSVGLQESDPPQPTKAVVEVFLVECLGCEKSLPWDDLADFDGICSTCAVNAVETVALVHEGVDVATPAQDGYPSAEASCFAQSAAGTSEPASQPRSSWRGKRNQKRNEDMTAAAR